MLQSGPATRRRGRSTTPSRSAPRACARSCCGRHRAAGAAAAGGFDGADPAAYPPRRAGTRSTTSCAARRRAAWSCCSRPRCPLPAGRRAAAGRRDAARLPARPGAVRRVPAGARAALLGPLRATRTRAAACCRAWSSWSFSNEPNQPALAAAAVRAPARRALCPSPPCSTARLVRPGSRACAAPATAATSCCSARRRRSDASTRPAGHRGRSPPGDVPAHAALPRRSRAAPLEQARGRARARLRAVFKRFAVTGFAHHPYTRGGSQPPTARAASANEITISSPRG